MRVRVESGLAVAVAEIDGLAQWMWRTYGTSSTGEPYGLDGQSGAYCLSGTTHNVRTATIDDGTTIEFYLVVDHAMRDAPPSETIDKRVKIWMFPEQLIQESDYYWRLTRKLGNLFSLLTCEHLDTYSILAYRSDFRQDLTRLFADAPIVVVSRSPSEDCKLSFSSMYYDFQRIESQFDEVIGKWFALYPKCEYALDLYFSNSIEKSNRYLSTRFAVAVMALDALYGGRGGTEKKLHRRIGELMSEYGECFGDAVLIRKRASRIVRLRKDVVHGSGDMRHVVDGSEEMVDALLNVEALFEMTVLSDLGLEVQELLERSQGLRRKVRLPRAFPHS